MYIEYKICICDFCFSFYILLVKFLLYPQNIMTFFPNTIKILIYYLIILLLNNNNFYIYKNIMIFSGGEMTLFSKYSHNVQLLYRSIMI